MRVCWTACGALAVTPAGTMNSEVAHPITRARPPAIQRGVSSLSLPSRISMALASPISSLVVVTFSYSGTSGFAQVLGSLSCTTVYAVVS